MNRIVDICSGSSTLTLQLPEQGMPRILNWSSNAAEGVANEARHLLTERANRINGMDDPLPSAVLLPTGGLGFFGWPAIAGHRLGRDFTLSFADWRAERLGSAWTLAGRDGVAAIDIEIVVEGSEAGVLRMRTRLLNRGSESYALDRCMAGTILVAEGPADLTCFTGTWGREFQLREEKLGCALWLQESRRGRTSHDKYPALILSAGGRSCGVLLGWSGNHAIAIDTLDDGRRLVHAGELFEPGEMQLAPGQAYESPTLYAAESEAGVAALSGRFRRFVSSELITWPGGAMRSRPVTLNTWEGNYFDHNLAALAAQAEAAARLGVERFVLDDGWFKNRHSDNAALGDWVVDQDKYPQGLGPLIECVRDLKMEFGLWVEPEMISLDSDLYRAHPEWALGVEGRPRLLSRNQLALDLTRPDASEHVFAQLDALLREYPIAYLKWDMNRDLAAAGGADGRAATSRQTHAVYALWDRLRAAHPELEIESCASGGGRADYGALARTHRVWTSDCTDARERLDVQRGASLFLPAEVLGAHVSASPNHQTGRRLSLAFRAIVAMPYHFGVELDPTKLTDTEFEELREWIVLHKRLRPILHNGNARHSPVYDGRYVVTAIEPGSKPRAAVVIVVQATYAHSEQPPPLRIDLEGSCRPWRILGQHPKCPDYIRVSDAQRRWLEGDAGFSAADLAASGLPLPALKPESGVILEFSAD